LGAIGGVNTSEGLHEGQDDRMHEVLSNIPSNQYRLLGVLISMKENAVFAALVDRPAALTGTNAVALLGHRFAELINLKSYKISMLECNPPVN
jgi:hypothetical protein